jgi:acyl-CoA thioesterase-1
MKSIVTLIIAALFSAASAAEPAPSSQLANHLRKGKSQHLVVYGTSLCTKQYSAWVDQVQALIEAGFPKLCTVTNSAQVGAASNWGLENIDQRVIAHKPDTVLIEFGINDAYTPYKISVADAQKNLETMIKKVQVALPNCEIILMTMNQPAHGVEPRPAFDDYCAMYRKVAKEQKLKLIDIVLVWEELFAADEKKWNLLVPDKVHPNADGNSLITTPTIMKGLFGAEKAQ